MTPDVEDRFDELGDWVAGAMSRALGNASAEREVITDAVTRYAEIRRCIDPEEPWSNVTHFLAGDGIAHRRPRTPAFLRVVGAGRPEIAHWCELAGDAERELEAVALGLEEPVERD